jgi:hypothetical protein
MATQRRNPNRGLIRQPRIVGVQREFKTQGLVPEVQDLVARDAARFGVTESFVKAEIITHHYAEVTGRTFSHISIEQATGVAQLRRRRRG